MTTNENPHNQERSPDIAHALDLLQVALYSLRDRGLLISVLECDEEANIATIQAHPDLSNSGSTFTDQVRKRSSF